jgi:hypothetical protein
MTSRTSATQKSILAPSIGRAGDAAEAKQRRDDGDGEEDNRPVQEISEIHDLNSVVST